MSGPEGARGGARPQKRLPPALHLRVGAYTTCADCGCTSDFACSDAHPSSDAGVCRLEAGDAVCSRCSRLESERVSLPPPAFDRAGVRLYQGDARLLVSHLEVTARTVVVTDPVWPNSAKTTLAGREDPAGLFLEVMGALVAQGLRRAIVTLGCDSDPRFLAGIPAALPFRRVTWLRLAVPSYRGPILGGADVAYVFGDFRMAFQGQVVWPGEIVANVPRARESWRTAHPCPRRMEHVRGLLVGYTRAEDHVLDPFAGGCSTLATALMLGREATGLEVEPAYCAEAAERLRDLACDPAPSNAGPLFAAR